MHVLQVIVNPDIERHKREEEAELQRQLANEDGRFVDFMDLNYDTI